jgi:poly(3-hydroxybutyrate) depolymerase
MTVEAPFQIDHVAQGCALGTRTELVTVRGHPHAWPGGHRTWIFAPKPSANVDASLLIADFLSNR